MKQDIQILLFSIWLMWSGTGLALIVTFLGIMDRSFEGFVFWFLATVLTAILYYIRKPQDHKL